MNRHRLTVLHNHLRDNVQDDQFDLGFWRCGITSCAFSHAATIPEFQEAGLYMDGFDVIPVFNDEEGYNAAASFFGLTDSQSTHLFHPDAYPSKASRHDVMNRITALLAESKKRNHDRY